MKIRLLLAILIIAFLAACHIGDSDTKTTAGAACTEVDGACRSNSECCSYGCQSGYCVPNPIEGGACKTTNDCIAGRLCKSKSCTTYVAGMCRDDADVCTAGSQCCGGHCGGYVVGSYGQCGPNHAPVAEAGPDGEISFVQPYDLCSRTNGQNLSTDPDLDPLHFTWSLDAVPLGSSTAYFSNNQVACPIFHPDVPGLYRLTLTVTDGTTTDAWRLSSVDYVSLLAINMPPQVTVNAGNPLPDSSRNVQLTVSGSAVDPDGEPITCTWTATAPGRSSPDARFTRSGPCSGATSFQLTPDLEGPWTVALAADDGFHADPVRPRPVVVTATVTVVNDAPIAGVHRPSPLNEPAWIYANLDASETVVVDTLDASPNTLEPAYGSSDKNGDTLGYQWTVASSPPLAIVNDLTGADTAAPTFTARAEGDYQLQLIVTDPPWDDTRDPIYRGADRPGASSTPLIVTVRVGPYIKPLAGSHTLIDADMAKGVTPNEIVLLGRDPLDNNPKLWVYAVDTGQEGAAIPIVDPVGGGYSNTPTSVGVTSNGSTAVVGDAVNVWTVSLASPFAVTKFDPGLTCAGCATVFPVGDVAVVGTRHAFFFRSNSTTTAFVKLDLSNDGFTSSPYAGRYGGSSDGAVKYLFVVNASSSRIDRYFIQSNQSLGWDTSVSNSCIAGDLFANQLGTYVFDSCGNAYTNGFTLALHPTLKLTPGPAHLDSLADGPTVTLGTNAQMVNRYTSTLLPEPAGPDYLPVWADVNGGKHQTAGQFAFLAPTGERIVFLHTGETVDRYGVLTFAP